NSRYYLYLVHLQLSFFFFHYSATPRNLHSFPTRCSSDLSGDQGRPPRSTPTRSEPSGACSRPCWRRRRLATLLSAARPLRSSSGDRKSTRLNSSHVAISYAVFCLKKKTVVKNYLSMNKRR